LKNSEKAANMKRPNAIVHMALWGGVTGWITAAAMLLVLNITELDGRDLISASALFGGISGTFLGFASGFIIHWLLQNTGRQSYEELTKDAEEMVSSFALLGMIILLFCFRVPFEISLLYATLIPVSLIFGTGRYFSKIKSIYPDIQAGLKAKNSEKGQSIVHNLEDKAKQAPAIATEKMGRSRKKEK
jgi:hypothetical protein